MAFATPRKRARTMQKTGRNYKDESCQASASQMTTSVLIATIRHEFYSVEHAENSPHLRRIIVDADSCFGVSRDALEPVFPCIRNLYLYDSMCLTKSSMAKASIKTTRFASVTATDKA